MITVPPSKSQIRSVTLKRMYSRFLEDGEANSPSGTTAAYFAYRCELDRVAYTIERKFEPLDHFIIRRSK